MGNKNFPAFSSSFALLGEMARDEEEASCETVGAFLASHPVIRRQFFALYRHEFEALINDEFVYENFAKFVGEAARELRVGKCISDINS